MRYNWCLLLVQVIQGVGWWWQCYLDGNPRMRAMHDVAAISLLSPGWRSAIAATVVELFPYHGDPFLKDSFVPVYHRVLSPQRAIDAGKFLGCLQDAAGMMCELWHTHGMDGPPGHDLKLGDLGSRDWGRLFKWCQEAAGHGTTDWENVRRAMGKKGES
jgi:hypothetical protein